MMKRVFLIVLDSFGIGEMPDAAVYGDQGSDTLGAVRKSPYFQMENMRRLGLFHIDGPNKEGGEQAQEPSFQGAVARMRERSKGKDTTIGHWEIAGVISEAPMPVFPQGFPKQLLNQLSEQTGRGILCNRPYSGTQVIRDYGREHMETGDLIVYTSADSVLQIAAHEDVVPVEELYRYCQMARAICRGPWGVGRVIARPFTGEWPAFTRTANRHDFSLQPPAPTMLDLLKGAGKSVISVGKIVDIFAERGITEYVRTENNADGIEKTLSFMKQDFEGLCFTNLVDFDMLYGHRNDRDGYAKALAYFDRKLPELTDAMGEEDLLIITADHGCDPDTPSTDHSREYVPMLMYGKPCKPGVNLGTRASFADIAATILAYFGVEKTCGGSSFLPLVMRNRNHSGTAGKWAYFGEKSREDAPESADGSTRMKKTITQEQLRSLACAAMDMRECSYAPYSGYHVGAALLTENGEIYRGCNIENASFSATNCAERTAFFKAVSEGERNFRAIAVAGAPKDSKKLDDCVPCGVCLQVMAEFCEPDFLVIMAKGEKDYTVKRLRELLPDSFRLQRTDCF